MTFKFQSLTDIVNMTNLIAISLINEIMWYGFVNCLVLILRKNFLRIGGKVCCQLNQLIIYIFVCYIPNYTMFVYLLEFKKIISFSYKKDLVSRCVCIDIKVDNFVYLIFEFILTE